MDKKDMPRRREAMELRVRRTMAALEKNNMSAYFAQTSEEAVRLVEGLLCAGDTISCGGSVTLDASGVKALMRSGRYNFLDREAVETDAERQAIYRQTFSADAFLTSSNAITERGELFNIDGGGNMGGAQIIGKSVQYAAIVVTVFPIMMIYPFFQKHFVKGVLIGSIKG